MKNKIWLLQIPFVLLFTACFVITEMGSSGSLNGSFMHEKVFSKLRSVSGVFTDLKFKIRGVQPPKNKIVVLEVDSDSLERYGRWPWHRDVTAKLIDKAFEAGAKVVGLDIAFSEKDQRIPEEMGEILKGQKMANLVDLFETDPVLASTIQKHANNLVLGWFTETACFPKYSAEDCPVSNEQYRDIPQSIEKFGFDVFNPNPGYDIQKTPLLSAVNLISNIPIFDNPGMHSGNFNMAADADGVIRRSSLLMMAAGKPYPTLALEMARVGLGEKIRLDLDSRERVANMSWVNSGKRINVNPVGTMEINFRGPGHSFPYVSALQLLDPPPSVQQEGRTLASANPTDLLKDAYVLIGLTAVGVFDMRGYPFDPNVAGVEGHATILDNILSGDSMSSASTSGTGFYLILLLMTVGAIAYAYASERLESIQGIALFLGVFLLFGFLDVEVLFKNNYNWDTGFLMMEMFSIFVMTVAAKYILEEQNKKFIRSAFSKYVAPSIVDSILKDPTKLTLGGEKRDLTILFSDIRSFTSFSEQMDAKQLSSFLNDYLGIMTGLVFSNDGTLDKYIGDAVMAFWGAPLDQPKHAYNCCMSALQMMKALNENKARWKSTYNVDVNIGIGINTGIVSVGNMGSLTNFEYTVIGDSVNLASRLEGLTKAYGVSIVTTRFTMDHIAELKIELPLHRTLDHVKVKGKKNAVELIQLLEEPLNQDGLNLFELGKHHYTKQKWDAAIECFQQANTLFGGADGPCVMYIERCEEFKKTAPEFGWDGSWEMHSK
jgi:adenylate cyclase